MILKVFIGYKDEDEKYHGFLGLLEAKEYELLKTLAERFSSLDILSTDELKALSDIKNDLAEAQIKLHELEEEYFNNNKFKKISDALGKVIESFDTYREDAPHLDFILSFCIIDASESDFEDDYQSGKFWKVYEDDAEEIEMERPTKEKKADKEEWINYLASVRAVPVWTEKYQPFPVSFRRLQQEGIEGDHLEGFGKKTRRRVAEILCIESKEDCEKVRREIMEKFQELTPLNEKIEKDEVKHIDVSEELADVIYEWTELLDGRRILTEATMSEDNVDAMEAEIEWWRDNMAYYDDITEYNLTTMFFRAVRNNVLKCKRSGSRVLSSVNWSEKIEIF